jgi:hypothetical protein
VDEAVDSPPLSAVWPAPGSTRSHGAMGHALPSTPSKTLRTAASRQEDKPRPQPRGCDFADGKVRELAKRDVYGRTKCGKEGQAAAGRIFLSAATVLEFFAAAARAGGIAADLGL